MPEPVRLRVQSSPREDGVASAEDHIAAEVHNQLLLEGLPDVNFREDTEAFGPEGFGNLPNGASFSSVFSPIAELAHEASSLLVAGG